MFSYGIAAVMIFFGVLMAFCLWWAEKEKGHQMLLHSVASMVLVIGCSVVTVLFIDSGPDFKPIIWVNLVTMSAVACVIAVWVLKRTKERKEGGKIK